MASPPLAPWPWPSQFSSLGPTFKNKGIGIIVFPLLIKRWLSTHNVIFSKDGHSNTSHPTCTFYLTRPTEVSSLLALLEVGWTFMTYRVQQKWYPARWLLSLGYKRVAAFSLLPGRSLLKLSATGQAVRLPWGFLAGRNPQLGLMKTPKFNQVNLKIWLALLSDWQISSIPSTK